MENKKTKYYEFKKTSEHLLGELVPEVHEYVEILEKSNEEMYEILLIAYKVIDDKKYSFTREKILNILKKYIDNTIFDEKVLVNDNK